MTLSVREKELARLCLEALDRGEVEIRGDRFYAGSVEVVPKLAYELVEPEEPQLGFHVISQEREMAEQPRFHEAPASKLRSSGEAGDREEESRRAAQQVPRLMRAAAQKFVWPTKVAALPKAALVRQDRQG